MRSFANNYYCPTHWTGCLRDMHWATRCSDAERLRENRKVAGKRGSDAPREPTTDAPSCVRILADCCLRFSYRIYGQLFVSSLLSLSPSLSLSLSLFLYAGLNCRRCWNSPVCGFAGGLLFFVIDLLTLATSFTVLNSFSFELRETSWLRTFLI